MKQENLAGLIELRGEFYKIEENLKFVNARKYQYEDIIISHRVGEKALCEYEHNDLFNLLGNMLTDICVMTGAILPESDELALSICKSFQKVLMQFGFENYSLKEILLAFEFNTVVLLKNDEGDFLKLIPPIYTMLNVGFLMKVLNNYKISRSLLDGKIKNAIHE